MTWVQTATNGPLPSDALYVGNDSDGTAIYVGRAYHMGDLIPAKIIPQKQAAYVSYNGEEIFVQNYEVLCGSNYMWMVSGYGEILPGAVPGGQTASGEPLYIGRAGCEGSITPGKIHPSHQCLYVPYDGHERSFQNYEILVERPQEDADCNCCCCC